MEALEFEHGFRLGGAGIFSEAREMELAVELLEVANDRELEQFLGDFIKKSRAARWRSPERRRQSCLADRRRRARNPGGRPFGHHHLAAVSVSWPVRRWGSNWKA